jgi:RNA polymerase sigma factor (TIGR02999 family)
MPLVYGELRKIAAAYLRKERPGQTLQPTALVNEAYLRLAADRKAPWKDRTHFLAIAALSMRQILVERARSRNAAKRGAGAEKVTLDDARLAVNDAARGIDVLALDRALEKLEALDAHQAKVVELRYFGGLTVEEAAEALEISPATVKRHWTLARAWLRRELEGADSE